MVRHVPVSRVWRTLAECLAIGISVGLAPRVVAEAEIRPTTGPFSSEWVEIVGIEATALPYEGGLLSIGLRNRSKQTVWATIEIRTPDHKQVCELTRRFDAGSVETYKCAQRVLIANEDYRLLVQTYVYKAGGGTTVFESPQTTFRFEKSDVDAFEALVSTVPSGPVQPPVDSTWHVHPGDRIRVHTSTPGRFTGTVATIDDTTIALTRGGNQPTVLRRQDITGLAVSVGRASRGKHALVGAAAGAVVGASIGFISGDDPPGFLALSAQQKAVALGTLFAAAGALIGLALPVEEWVQVPVVHARIGIRPIHGRQQLSLAYSF